MRASASRSVHEDATRGTSPSHASNAVAASPRPEAMTAAILLAVATPRSDPSGSTTSAHRAAEPSRTASLAARAASIADALASTRGASVRTASETRAARDAERAASRARRPPARPPPPSSSSSKESTPAPPTTPSAFPLGTSTATYEGCSGGCPFACRSRTFAPSPRSAAPATQLATPTVPMSGTMMR